MIQYTVNNKIILLSCEDIFVQICNHLSKLSKIIKLEQLTRHHKYIIRKNNWMTFTVRPINIIHMDFILGNYNFKIYDLSYKTIKNFNVMKLKNCHTLNLSDTTVTDSIVCELGNCHTLYLAYTKITDEPL